MPYVLDASVTCAWFFPDEITPEANQLLEESSGTEVYVPGLWRLEVTNALVLAERRGRIPHGSVSEHWAQLEKLPIRRTAWEPPVSRTVELCQEHGLTAYDAEYLALAQWLGMPLATLDTRLAAAARAEGIAVLGCPANVDDLDSEAT